MLARGKLRDMNGVFIQMFALLPSHPSIYIFLPATHLPIHQSATQLSAVYPSTTLLPICHLSLCHPSINLLILLIHLPAIHSFTVYISVFHLSIHFSTVCLLILPFVIYSLAIHLSLFIIHSLIHLSLCHPSIYPFTICLPINLYNCYLSIYLPISLPFIYSSINHHNKS